MVETLGLILLGLLALLIGIPVGILVVILGAFALVAIGTLSYVAILAVISVVAAILTELFNWSREVFK